MRGKGESYRGRKNNEKAVAKSSPFCLDEDVVHSIDSSGDEREREK